MFPSSTYTSRRVNLKKLVKSGVIFLPGNNESPRNYPAEFYKFRQDSSFLYYFGLDFDGLAGVIDVDNDIDILFGNDRNLDDVVWMGPDDPLKVKAEKVGITNTKPFKELSDTLKKAKEDGRKIHYLPQYKHDLIIAFEDWLGIHPSKNKEGISQELIDAVVAQRSIKSDEEIAEMEKALEISYAMNVLAMKYTKPGLLEREVYGAVEGLALGMGNGTSFPIIFSVHGETLHNHHHNNIMNEGELAVLDSGAESLLHYSSDITRTFPVSGKFTDKQKVIYETVLRAETTSIEMIKPGISFRECHLNAAKVIAEGLKEVGLMKGNVHDAVSAGAHALFFPHGLGHMIGLDTHDMEGLGENNVGYDSETKRSDQFGLAYLRFAKTMQPGHVLTVEPGCYFIPQLIMNWKAENKHSEFINYDKAEEYIGFGGIRIEDDVLVTNEGYKVLGAPIPKTVEEVEEVCNS